MKDNIIENGLHIITGIGECSWYDEWYFRYVEAVVVQIDGENYAIYTNPDDGFRSYGDIRKTEHKPTVTFPPEYVYAWTKEDEGETNEGWSFHEVSLILNNLDGEELLRVGTDYGDEFYPVAIFEWHPELLAINKKSRKLS